MTRAVQDPAVVGGTSVVPTVVQVRARTRARAVRVIIPLAVVLVLTMIVTVILGDYKMTPMELLNTALGNGSKADSYILWGVRAPRLMMAIVGGAALGLAGALMQSLLSNPLASPDLLGISGGASAAAVFVIVVVGATGPILALASFAGGIAVAAFLLLVAFRRTQGGYRLILAGVGIAFLASAFINLLMVRAPDNVAQSAIVWLAGSLSATPWWQVLTVAAVMIAVAPIVFVSSRRIPLAQLGHATSVGLGVSPGGVRVSTVTASVLLTSVTCAFIGPVAFIALGAPALARTLLGRGSIGIGTSAIVGAVLLALADLIAQYIIPGTAMPVGVVTGALGAPFLLWFLATSKGRQL